MATAVSGQLFLYHPLSSPIFLLFFSQSLAGPDVLIV